MTQLVTGRRSVYGWKVLRMLRIRMSGWAGTVTKTTGKYPKRNV